MALSLGLHLFVPMVFISQPANQYTGISRNEPVEDAAMKRGRTRR